MKKHYPLLILLFFSLNALYAQKVIKHVLLETSVVKDSTGMVYPYAIWSKLYNNGDCKLRVEDPASENSAFIIHLNSAAEKDEVISHWRKPTESEVFKIGDSFSCFKEKALDGFKIDPKLVAGKVLVINFWFIGCPPCRAEIPDLDNVARLYKDNPDVIFVAIGLDEGWKIKDFVKEHPLAYHIIDEGQFIANKYGVHLYPTNVVIDRQGKVVYSSVSSWPQNSYWLKKTINEALQPTIKNSAFGD